ncbi:hypothetical protein [Salinimicrobium flavum]|uniref:Uncharacterized protein n=1 Tax=Salinimicrobium flavum TaxID=1737065 RepID=A0ABW5IY65_9FLAO
MEEYFKDEKRRKEIQRLSEGTMRITNILFLLLSFLILFSFLMLLFDKGAVMVAEEVVQAGTSPPR